MPVSGTLLKYFNTVRYLKPQQVLGRIWYRVHTPSLRELPAPERRRAEGTWEVAANREPTLVGPSRARLLNQTEDVSDPGIWNNADLGKLWLYHLHYFDDLNAREAGSRADWHRMFVGRWVAENLPAKGVGWEPYPTSRRIVNWIKFALRGNELEQAWIDGLATQARWLERRIEWHLLGNHLLSNAKALVFAGAFVRGGEADRWREKGLKILAAQLPEQVLTDGGHFERSPMYHALMLEDLLDLLNLANAYPGAFREQDTSAWRQTARKMVAWLAAMCHPDGEIAFFNDAAIGMTPKPAELFDYGHRLGVERPGEPASAEVGSVLGRLSIRGAGTADGGHGWSGVSLGESGYMRCESGSAVALLDVAPVGPDYLPGHAHADTLSFELSVHGQRVVVNSGTSRYGTDAERVRQRGTAAHSTVQIGRFDSSEVWSGFRVARRARPFGLDVREDRDGLAISCAHDGYKRLRGRPVHRRRWVFGAGRLVIEDEVEGAPDTATARFHLHPDISIEADGDGWRLALPDGGSVNWRIEGGECRLVKGTYHPEFGLTVPNHHLEVTLTDERTRSVISW